ncbi:MAG: hypothetical protein NBV67_00190 [Tagaea sp.]|nr:hypothetical protein [Tagaea sp.]
MADKSKSDQRDGAAISNFPVTTQTASPPTMPTRKHAEKPASATPNRDPKSDFGDGAVDLPARALDRKAEIAAREAKATKMGKREADLLKQLNSIRRRRRENATKIEQGRAAYNGDVASDILTEEQKARGLSLEGVREIMRAIAAAGLTKDQVIELIRAAARK